MTILPALLTQLAPDAKEIILALNQALGTASMTMTYTLSGLMWATWSYSGYFLIGLVFGILPSQES